MHPRRRPEHGVRQGRHGPAGTGLTPSSGCRIAIAHPGWGALLDRPRGSGRNFEVRRPRAAQTPICYQATRSKSSTKPSPRSTRSFFRWLKRNCRRFEPTPRQPGIAASLSGPGCQLPGDEETVHQPESPGRSVLLTNPGRESTAPQAHQGIPEGSAPRGSGPVSGGSGTAVDDCSTAHNGRGFRPAPVTTAILRHSAAHHDGTSWALGTTPEFRTPSRRPASRENKCRTASGNKCKTCAIARVASLATREPANPQRPVLIQGRSWRRRLP